MNNTFEDIKKAYVNARKNEQDRIISFLLEKGFSKKTPLSRGGSGISKYTSGGQIAEYDLSNWKWIKLYKDGLEFFITFQPWEQDPKSKNKHCLFDRIGVTVSNEDDEIRKITSIDLPMDDNKFSKLIDEIDLMVNSINKK